MLKTLYNVGMVYRNEEFDRNGDLVKVEFLPSADMLRFAMERANFKHKAKSDEELLISIGMTKSKIDYWKKHHDPYFSEWLIKCLENFQAPAREALLAFGIDQAFRGNYNYWKDVSRTLGAISGEKVEIKATLSRGIDELAALPANELALEEQRILAALSGVSPPTDQVATTPSGEESGSSESGDSQMQERSEVLAF